jgi:hypothetical protein
MERVKGIEPSFRAWEAHVLPLNHTRVVCPGQRPVRDTPAFTRLPRGWQLFADQSNLRIDPAHRDTGQSQHAILVIVSFVHMASQFQGRPLVDGCG